MTPSSVRRHGSHYLAHGTVLSSGPQLSRTIADLQQQIPDQQYVISSRTACQQVDESNRKSFERLSGTLGHLSQATEQMIDIGSEIASLEDLLKPPTLRGGLGETMLYQLLSETIPGHYETQYANFNQGRWSMR